MPRPDMRAERIPQIIQAAMAVFARSGFAQTRMEDIAQEAGLSKATLYLYFPSKDDMIVAILQNFFDHGFSELSTLLAADGPVAERLAGWARQRAQEMQGQAAFLGIGFEFYAVAARQEATRLVLQRYYRQYVAGLAALIEQGQQRGELRAASPHDLAVALAGSLEGLTLLWMLDPEAIDPERASEQAVRLLLGAG
ncbi:MAG: TetR family transcriptional regulator [Roseiflexaceae bacterium]